VGLSDKCLDWLVDNYSSGICFSNEEDTIVIPPLEYELYELGLADFEPANVSGSSIMVWLKPTEEGRKAAERLAALRLAQKWVVIRDTRFFAHIARFLTAEELPEFLVHENPEIREIAGKRAEELGM